MLAHFINQALVNHISWIGLLESKTEHYDSACTRDTVDYSGIIILPPKLTYCN